MGFRGLTSLFLGLTFILSSHPQESARKENIREYVQIVNVELILRVVKDGQAEGGFKKEDFRLFENGRECRINGFFETRRQMAPRERSELNPSRKAPKGPKRLFLLLFWSSRDKGEIDRQLDRFFKSIYQPGDRVILGSTSRFVEYHSPEDRITFVSHCQDMSQKKQQDNRQSMSALRRIIDNALNDLASLDLSSPNEAIRRLAQMEATSILNNLPLEYKQTLTEWQLFFDRLDSGGLERLADNLEQINSDKWVLVFYERDSRPLLNSTTLQDELSRALRGFLSNQVTACKAKIEEITISAKSSAGFGGLYRSLSQTFSQSGAVFHLLQMSPRPPESFGFDAGGNSLAIDYEPVFSNWDAVFQTISKGSGGQRVDLDREPDVLERLARQEDISYTLTYVPLEKEARKRRIELKIASSELKEWQKHLLYGRRLEMKEVPPLRVAGISSNEKTLQVQLESFYPVLTTSGAKGHFGVILAAEKNGHGPATVLYQQDLESDGVFDIPLSLEEPGDWTLWLRLVDRMSGQSLMEKRKITILAEEEKTPVPSPPIAQAEPDELNTALLKAAAYSERIKKTALRFTCLEEISQWIHNRKSGTDSPRFDKNVWRYDYQIVLDRGALNEQRLLISKNRKRSPTPREARLESVYESQYSFFLPATILGAHRQSEYTYELTGRCTIKKRKMLQIRARAKQENSNLPAGELWVDVADGSVWKIILDARSVPGFRHRFENAGKRGIHLIMSDVHEYFHRYQGIQFPTDTRITENHTYTKVYEEHTLVRGNFGQAGVKSQREAPPIQLDVLRVHYRYSRYRFFEISSREIVTSPDLPEKTDSARKRP